MYCFFALLFCSAGCAAADVLFFTINGVASVDEGLVGAVKNAGGAGLCVEGVVDGCVFLRGRGAFWIYRAGAIHKLCDDGDTVSAACSRLGLCVDNGRRVTVYTTNGKAWCCCPVTGGGTLESDTHNAVLWSSTTLSLVSVTGGWSWNFYRSGDGAVSTVQQPELKLSRGAVLASWPNLVVCVDRGCELWRCDGRCIGVCGSYAIVRDKRGVLCIDCREGKKHLLVKQSELRGLKRVCVVGDRLCLVGSGVVTIDLPALIKRGRLVKQHYPGPVKVLRNCIVGSRGMLVGLGAGGTDGGVTKYLPARLVRSEL